tara:strand:- start:7747 stop:7938 length:192 start_codon:yes stop_codon:yes gene_type:complete
MTKIKYKDGRDETIVYAGLKTLGRIKRVDGGWAYHPEENEDAARAVFPSRQKVKEALQFLRRA